MITNVRNYEISKGQKYHNYGYARYAHHDGFMFLE